MAYLKSSIPLSYGNSAKTDMPREGIYITLPDVTELETLPASGEITFRYCRENLKLGKDDKLSAEICLCELVDVEPDAEAESKTDDVVDKLFDEAKSAPEESDENE